MDKVVQAQGLAQLTALEFRSAMAEITQLAQREAGLRQNLDQLLQSKHERANAVISPNEAAFAAGADVRWLQWVDQRRAVINTELAQVMAFKENYRAKLTKAFGRDQAVQALLKKLQQDQKLSEARRGHYES